MNKDREIAFASTTWGDSTVDGLFAGVAAGFIMFLYLLAAGVASGLSASDVPAAFNPAGEGSPLTGMLGHLAVAGMYGSLFALALRAVPRALLRRLPLWFVGLGYGLALLLLAQSVFRSGSPTLLWETVALPWALGHILYGTLLGALVAQQWQT